MSGNGALGWQPCGRPPHSCSRKLWRLRACPVCWGGLPATRCPARCRNILTTLTEAQPSTLVEVTVGQKRGSMRGTHDKSGRPYRHAARAVLFEFKACTRAGRAPSRSSCAATRPGDTGRPEVAVKGHVRRQAGPRSIGQSPGPPSTFTPFQGASCRSVVCPLTHNTLASRPWITNFSPEVRLSQVALISIWPQAALGHLVLEGAHGMGGLALLGYRRHWLPVGDHFGKVLKVLVTKPRDPS